MKTLVRLFASFFLCLFILVGLSAYAQKQEATGGHSLMSPQELEIKNKAKKRLYPGGQDQESLKVQAQLPQVSRKMAPVTENPTEEPEPNADEY